MCTITTTFLRQDVWLLVWALIVLLLPYRLERCLDFLGHEHAVWESRYAPMGSSGDADPDVKDRLRNQARRTCRADVVDAQGEGAERLAQARAEPLELLGPAAAPVS